jgi:predicted nucleic acid-binding protein
MKPMSDKSFLDTNVLIYCYTETEPSKRAIAIAIAAQSGSWISTQVLQELANTLNRKFKIPWSNIDAALLEVSQNLNLYTNSFTTLQAAIKIAERYGFSFYDSLIISSCIEIGCNVLYTEDLQHGQLINGILEIQNPFKILEQK